MNAMYCIDLGHHAADSEPDYGLPRVLVLAPDLGLAAAFNASQTPVPGGTRCKLNLQG